MQYYLLLLFFFDGVHGRGDLLIKWAQCQCPAPVLKWLWYGINTIKTTPAAVSLLSLLWRNVQRNVMRVSLAADRTLTRPPSAVYIPRSRHSAAAVTPSASYWSPAETYAHIVTIIIHSSLAYRLQFYTVGRSTLGRHKQLKGKYCLTSTPPPPAHITRFRGPQRPSPTLLTVQTPPSTTVDRKTPLGWCRTANKLSIKLFGYLFP